MEHGRNQPGVASRASTSQLEATQASTANNRGSLKNFMARKLLTKLRTFYWWLQGPGCKGGWQVSNTSKFVLYIYSHLLASNSWFVAHQQPSKVRARLVPKIESQIIRCMAGVSWPRKCLYHIQEAFISATKPRKHLCKHMVNTCCNYCDCYYF